MFYKNYYAVYGYYCGVFIEKYVCTKFHLNWLLVSEMAIYVPIIMYGLRLFYKTYIVYQNVYMFVLSELEDGITSPSFVALNLMVSEIAKYIA